VGSNILDLSGQGGLGIIQCWQGVH
jgi:hypothetical protein